MHSMSCTVLPIFFFFFLNVVCESLVLLHMPAHPDPFMNTKSVDLSS